MKHKILTFTAIAVAMSLPMSSAQAITGETMVTPFFTGSDYSSWTLNAPWRDDGAGDQLIFDINDTNPVGFIAAVGTGRDLATAPEITSAPGFTSADNSILTGFTFNSPFIQTFAAGNIAGGDYNLFFEVDIITTGGTYRAKSENFNNPWLIGSGGLSPNFVWETSGFLGAPEGALGGGVTLSEITSIEYRAVMETVSIVTNPNSSTGFFALDNMSLTYNVSNVPEPSSYALLAGILGLGYVMTSRRKK